MNKSSNDELNETINRLIIENNQWRKKFEEIETLLRIRGDCPAELSTKTVIVSLLNERDKLFSIVENYKIEIKKLLKLIIYNDIDKLKEEINLMMFDINNHKI